MAKKEEPISIRAYARTLNVDEKSVRKAIADGKIKKGYNKAIKKIIESKANQEWGSIHQVARPQRGVSKAKVVEKMNKKQPEKPIKNREKDEEDEDFPGENGLLFDKEYTYEELIDAIKMHPDMPYHQAIRLKEILNIAGERMKLEEQRGLLVRKAEVEKSLFAVGDMLKKSLLNIPSRCIDDIRATTNKIDATTILTLEIQSVLNQFAQHLHSNGN